jgi:hypothetical protein
VSSILRQTTKVKKNRDHANVYFCCWHCSSIYLLFNSHSNKHTRWHTHKIIFTVLGEKVFSIHLQFYEEIFRLSVKELKQRLYLTCIEWFRNEISSSLFSPYFIWEFMWKKLPTDFISIYCHYPMNMNECNLKQFQFSTSSFNLI